MADEALSKINSAVNAFDNAGRSLHDYCVAKLQNAERIYHELSLAVEVQGYNLLSPAAVVLQQNGREIPTTTEAMGQSPSVSSSLSAIPFAPVYKPLNEVINAQTDPPFGNQGCQTLDPLWLGLDGYCRCETPDVARQSTWLDGTPIDPGYIDTLVRAGESQFGKDNYVICLQRDQKQGAAVGKDAMQTWYESCATRHFNAKSGMFSTGMKCQFFCNSKDDRYVWARCIDPAYCKVELAAVGSGCHQPSGGECNDPPIVESECDPSTGIVTQTTTFPCTGETTATQTGTCPIETPTKCCPPAQITFAPTIEPAEVKVEIAAPERCKPDADGNEVCKIEQSELIGSTPYQLGLDWCSPAACDLVNAKVSQLGEAFKPLYEWASKLSSQSIDDWIKSVTGLEVDVVPPLFRFILDAAFGIVRGVAASGVKMHESYNGCLEPAVIAMQIGRSAWTAMEKWIGVDLSKLRVPVTYAIDYKCPQEIPSADEANAAFLRDQITEPMWECWVQANNKCLDAWRTTMLSEQAIPDIPQTLSLNLREWWDVDTTNEFLRKNGVLDPRVKLAMSELARFIPPYTDLVRMMVRDTEDDTVATKYGYDEEFGDKYKGQLKKWVKAQGIDDDVMKRIWRMHWQLPSAGQAYEMLHRLRPGKPGVKNPITREDVGELLAINDVPKYWRDRLVDISYNVLRLVDLRNMYLRSVIDDDGIVSALQDRGYTEEDANLTLQLFVANKREWALARPESKQYAAGDISQRELRDSLKRYQITGNNAEWVIDRLDIQMGRNHRKKCIAALRKRFLCGEMDVALTIGNLTEFGFDGDEAAKRVQQWQCEMAGKCRQPTASMLCGWFQLGLITGPDLRSRLMTLGYSRESSINISAKCVAGGNKQKEKEEKQKQQREEKKKCPPVSCEQKKSDKANAEQQKREKAYRQTLRHTATVLSKVMKTARKLAELTGKDWDNVIDDVRDMMCQLKSLKGVDEADALGLIDELIAGAEQDGRADIEPDYLRLLEMLSPPTVTPEPCIVGPITENPDRQ